MGKWRGLSTEELEMLETAFIVAQNNCTLTEKEQELMDDLQDEIGYRVNK